MNPCVSPFSTARATRVIGRFPTRTACPLAFASASVSADPSERRIDVEGVGGDAVGHLAPRAVEQVGGDDLVIVVGGVGEGAAAVAVAERQCAGRWSGARRRRRCSRARRPRRPRRRARDRRCSACGRPRGARASRPRRARRRAVDADLTSVAGGAKRMHSASQRTAIPSASRMARIASDMSGSSRATRRGAFSITVTSAPKRRKSARTRGRCSCRRRRRDGGAGCRGRAGTCSSGRGPGRGRENRGPRRGRRR